MLHLKIESGTLKESIEKIKIEEKQRISEFRTKIATETVDRVLERVSQDYHLIPKQNRSSTEAMAATLAGGGLSN